VQRAAGRAVRAGRLFGTTATRQRPKTFNRWCLSFPEFNKPRRPPVREKGKKKKKEKKEEEERKRKKNARVSVAAGGFPSATDRRAGYAIFHQTAHLPWLTDAAAPLGRESASFFSLPLPPRSSSPRPAAPIPVPVPFAPLLLPRRRTNRARQCNSPYQLLMA